MRVAHTSGIAELMLFMPKSVQAFRARRYNSISSVASIYNLGKSTITMQLKCKYFLVYTMLKVVAV
jgi:hypothetical protein